MGRKKNEETTEVNENGTRETGPGDWLVLASPTRGPEGSITTDSYILFDLEEEAVKNFVTDHVRGVVIVKRRIVVPQALKIAKGLF